MSIAVTDAENVHILGYGTIDARGYELAEDANGIGNVRLKVRALTIERSRNVTVEGLTCLNSTSWSVPFYNSTDVIARRVKVINDIGSLKHSDGINLCAVKNGLVEDCFVHTTDDAYCAKDYKGNPSENLTFRRLVALSGTRGAKCGMQAYEGMKNVLFEDIDVVQTRDGIDLMHKDGSGDWKNITFRDIRVERCSGNSIMASISGGGTIHGVRFQQISFADVRPGYLRGKSASSSIKDVSFSQVTMGGRLVEDLKSANISVNPFVYEISFSTSARKNE